MTSATNERPLIQAAAEFQALLHELAVRRRTPVSTYRLQMHSQFRFADAQAILPYLAELGITDCYTSPILKARPHSQHGYDITDHNALNPDLGSENDYEKFAEALKQKGMGHILDFVPNHMGIDPDTNPWWRDVLENGQSSPYADYFDIDWWPVKPELHNKILLPILGDPYGVVLERGDLQLVFHDGALGLHCGATTLPIDPRETPRVLLHNVETLENNPDAREFLSVLTSLSNLPPKTERDPKRILEKQREKEVARQRLSKLLQGSPLLRRHVEDGVNALNGEPGKPESFDALHDLLETQAYRLAFWKTAAHEINYRRFFDVNDLAGLRQEDPDVFAATHRLVLKLIAEGKITGLRLDHIDGLYDPAGYSEALQDAFLQAWVREQWKKSGRSDADLPADWVDTLRAWRVAERKKDPSGLAARPLYLAAEKILSPEEELDPHWAIDGTSGYDFLNEVNGLFVDPPNDARFLELYARFTGNKTPSSEIPYLCKKLIMSTSMSSELSVLAHALNQISEADRKFRDYTLSTLLDALKEVIACFPVYRTYINASRCSAWDRRIIKQAVDSAKRRGGLVPSNVMDFIEEVLVPGNIEKVPMEEFRRQLHFAMKFQQYSGPVQAKGLEDTSFYRYNRLLSLNEVGGTLDYFGTGPQAFHEKNLRRQKEWPYAMLATATHDTKRGEDARARLNVLSEIPDEWEHHLLRWGELNAHLRIRSGGPALDRHDEYLYYQTLVGIWPTVLFGPQVTTETAEWKETAKRVETYMLKAVKESRRHTSWITPNPAYEMGVQEFVRKTLSGERSQLFRQSFLSFAERVARAGVINSLAQVALKIGSPGIPDFYQGTELWDLNLVDPDNRRPVDFESRKRLLAGLSDPGVSTEELLRQWPDGRIKLWVTATALRYRQSHADHFLKGNYIPLKVEGDLAGHVVAFAREYGQEKLAVIVPRLLARYPSSLPAWGSTRVVLPEAWKEGSYRQLFSRKEVSVSKMKDADVIMLSEAFAGLPIAWLVPV